MVPPVEETGTIVVLTPMNLEYQAMRSFFTDVEEEPHPRGTVFEVGRIRGVPWKVAILVTGEGNRPAAAMAERAIAHFEPVALLVVGVAGALKPDIELGDVVVSSWVYAYGSGKEDDEGFHVSPRAWPSSHRLDQAAKAVGRQGVWSASLPSEVAPVVHFKPIAAGDVVLNSRTTPLAQQLKEHYRDAVAIEMESAGVADAAHLNDDLPLLTIRGISDKADGNKHICDGEGLQPVAASHAAAFTVALLQKLPLVLLPAGGRRRTFPRPAMVQNIVGAPGGTLNVVQHGNQYFGHRDSESAGPLGQN